MGLLAQITSVTYRNLAKLYIGRALGRKHKPDAHVKRWQYIWTRASLEQNVTLDGEYKKCSKAKTRVESGSRSSSCDSVHMPYGNFSRIFCTLQAIAHSGHRRVYSTLSDNLFSLQNLKLKVYIESLVEKHESLQRSKSEGDSQYVDPSVYKLGPLVATYKDYLEQQANAEELHCIISENVDPDMTEMAKADLQQINENISQLEEDIVDLVMPIEKVDESDVILEVSAGVGGQEAMLFTKEIFQMYSRYAAYRGWLFDVISSDDTDQGGLRKASASVGGRGVYQYLKYEGGVHRVQRVPKTEKSGRIHTSTMTVAVMPLPTEIEIELHPKDLKITTMRASGAGGQHVNKTESAVRIVHVPTGTVAECQIDRSQFRNKEIALQMLRSKLYDKELEKVRKNEVTQRKLQVGTSGRSEKIRTFNFPQDRVTDHRVGISMHHIQGVMAGGEELHGLMESLQEEGHKESLFELLGQFEKEQAATKEEIKR